MTKDESKTVKAIIANMISEDPTMAKLLKGALSVLYNRGLGRIMVEDLQMVFISAFYTK